MVGRGSLSRDSEGGAAGSRPVVILFSSAYLDDHLWTNKQHVATRLASYGEVLFVEPGLSLPILVRRLREFRWLDLLPDRAHSSGMRVLSPWFLLFRRGPRFLRSLCFRLLSAWIRWRLKGVPGRRVLLVYHPAGVELVGPLGPDRVIYDCVDDLATQPHFKGRPDLGQLIQEQEQTLIRTADLVISTSSTLHARNQNQARRAVLIENVGDFDHFSRVARDSNDPDPFPHIPRPRIGFAGALDPYKLDYDLLEILARELDPVPLVLIGPRSTVETNLRLETLEQRENVFSIGSVAFSEMPTLLGGLDVHILPYALNEHTRYIFPIKFFECMATGRPVVVSALESLSAYRDVCPAARTPEEWVLRIREALADGSTGRDQRVDLASRHTWNDRVRRIREEIARLLDDCPP